MGEPRPPTAPSRYPDCEIGIRGASQNRMLRIESVPGAPKKIAAEKIINICCP